MGGKGGGKGPPPPRAAPEAGESAEAKEEKQRQLQAERERRVAAQKAKLEEERLAREAQAADARARLEKCRITHDPHELCPQMLLRKERKIVLAPDQKVTFVKGVGARPDLHGDFQSCTGAHGTNLAVLIQALRNCNGQLVNLSRRNGLGVRSATGEYHGPGFEAPPFVSVANLLKKGGEWGPNTSLAESYALKETSRQDHVWGAATVEENSAAARIPVLLVGDLVDIDGSATEYHKSLLKAVPRSTSVSKMGSQLPGLADGFDKIQAQQDEARALAENTLWCERLNIRMVFVWDPEAPENDMQLLTAVTQLVEGIDAELDTEWWPSEASKDGWDEWNASAKAAERHGRYCYMPEMTVENLLANMCCSRSTEALPKARGGASAPRAAPGFRDIRVGLLRDHVRVFNEAVMGRSEAVMRWCIQRHLHDLELDKYYPPELS